MLVMAVLAAVGAGGCVEREMTITSEPPGALVFISGEPVGRTPVTQKFEWYGDYDIILRYPEQGYETLKTHAGLNPPPYEIPPIDLLSHLAPWTYHDRRYLHYKLHKRKPLTDDELIQRATDLKKRNLEPVEP